MALFLSIVVILVAICLLVFILLKVCPFRYQKLTLVSLSVFINTAILFLLVDERVFFDFYGIEKEMLWPVVEDGFISEFDTVEVIDGKTYIETTVLEHRTWARFLFGLMRLAQNAALYLLAWVAISTRAAGKIDISGADESPN